MSNEKQPNIVECDGLVIRGPSGAKRASITVQTYEGEEHVCLELFAAGVDEPAFYADVDQDGRTRFDVSCADTDGDIFGGVSIDSGDAERPPRFAFFGRRGNSDDGGPSFELPAAH